MSSLSFIRSNTKAVVLALAVAAISIAILSTPASADASYSQGSYASSNGKTVVHTAPFCGVINRSLSMGSRDAATNDQVSALQRFLAQDASIYPEGDITGYFGSLTQRAIERFQTRYGIVSSGTPHTTGYGSVGVRTRAMIEKLCGDHTEEKEDADEENDIESIDEIVVYLDTKTKRAQVEVIIHNAPDLAFTHTYISKAKTVTFIGEKLESVYKFDFSEFRTDRLRDARLKRLVQWEEEVEDTDEDTLTISDIRKITVEITAHDGYADVLVDLKEGDDLSFDVVEGSQQKMVTAIAEKLENSYDFDFDAYSSDRKRDAEVKKNIQWIHGDPDDVELRIKGSIYGGCQRGGACSSYVLDGRTFTLTEGKMMTCLSLDCQKTKTIKGTLSESLYEELVDELTDAVLKAQSKTNAHRTATCMSYIDGNDYTYKVSADGGTEYTLDTCKTVFGNNSELKSLLAQTWAEMKNGTPTAGYSLSDVQTVTAVAVDPIAGAIDDEYTLYTITLKDGTKHEVKTYGMVPAESNERAFKATGYTGDVSKLMAMAKEVSQKSYSIKDVKTVTSKYVDPIPNAADDEYTVYTITLKNGIKHEAKVGFTTTEYRNKQFTNTGYTGDIDKLIALAKSTANDATMCLSDGTYYREGTQKSKVTHADKTTQAIADGVFTCVKSKWITRGSAETKTPTTPFEFKDIRSAVSKFFDPTPANSRGTHAGDEYTQYTLTLKDGSKRTVDVDFSSYTSVIEQFKKIGFSGSVWDITIMAAKGDRAH